jgi:hypothetical protein
MMTTKRVAVLFAATVALAASASAEEWKNVPVVDTHCLSKVKADPDKHPTSCALQCVKGGYGILTSDGTYLKFDAAGDEKATAALKATKKTDHLRATVVGTRDGEKLKVTSLTLD